MANQSQSQGYRRQSASQKIVLQTNTFLLDRIILALLQYANNRRFVANVSKLFSLIDDNDFRNDADKDLRVYIIRKVLDALLSNDRLVDKTAIMNTVDMSGRLSDQAITQFSVYANQTIDDNDLKNIDQTVSQKVKYGIVISKSDKLVNLIDTVRSESYDDLETEMTKIEDTTSEFSRDLREARESADDTKNEVDLSDQAFTGALSRGHRQASQSEQQDQNWHQSHERDA
jgi:hypothetical protein